MSESRARESMSVTDPAPTPTAVLRAERRWSLAWLIPLAALVFACWIGWRAWQARGLSVTVQLDNGYGLKTGDDVRFRGITVGRIDDVSLAGDLQSVTVTARLTSQADLLARAGTRFWVVRPQLGLSRIEGLDTIIGPRFLAVLPSIEPGMRMQRRFVGLASAPIVESMEPGDLEVVLEAADKGSLAPGTPVLYRQTRVGTILSVGLAGDGGSVEARAHIQQPYAQLIRPQTRFWDVGGVQATFSLTGVSIDIDSAEALLTGGVALATPPGAGEVVRTGHRFVMDTEPKVEWLAWQPRVAIGSSLLPAGMSPPSPQRASLGWEEGRIFSSEESRHGWVLQTDDGLLGPADLVKPAAEARERTAVLEVAGEVVPLEPGPKWEHNSLAMLEARLSSQPAWPMARIREMTAAEECVAITDSIVNPFPIAAARLSPITSEGGSSAGWNIDSAVAIDESWHGACVVARSDGKIVGLLLINDEGEARVATIER
jgi:hypothetical protein